MDRDGLFEHLKFNTKVLKDPLVEKAFKEVDRKDFVLKDYEFEAYEDYALPMGFGSTISQPTTVAFMLELLEVHKGGKVLDIGSGSGFTSVLLSRMVGDKGFVFSTEIIPEMFHIGKINAKKYHLNNLKQILVDEGDRIGVPGEKFDNILVSASGEVIPDDLLSQLNEGGVIVLPIGNSIWKIKKNKEGGFDSIEYPGFSFVPLK